MTSLKAQVASLQEQNAELKEIVVKGFDNILSSLMIKKDKPVTKKTSKVAKVVAGAGAPDKEEAPTKKKVSDMTPLEKAERNVENWKKRLVTNKPVFKTDEAREVLEKNLKLEEATVRKLKGEDTPAEKVPPTELSFEDLLALKKSDKIKIEPKAGEPGVYWRSEDGVYVTGPSYDDDEEYVTKNYKGAKYLVGLETRRVRNPESAAAKSLIGYEDIDFEDMKTDDESEHSE